VLGAGAGGFGLYAGLGGGVSGLVNEFNTAQERGEVAGKDRPRKNVEGGDNNRPRLNSA
jgi:hypothetical protein